MGGKYIKYIKMNRVQRKPRLSSELRLPKSLGPINHIFDSNVISIIENYLIGDMLIIDIPQEILIEYEIDELLQNTKHELLHYDIRKLLLCCKCDDIKTFQTLINTAPSVSHETYNIFVKVSINNNSHCICKYLFDNYRSITHQFLSLSCVLIENIHMSNPPSPELKEVLRNYYESFKYDSSKMMISCILDDSKKFLDIYNNRRWTYRNFSYEYFDYLITHKKLEFIDTILNDLNNNDEIFLLMFKHMANTNDPEIYNYLSNKLNVMANDNIMYYYGHHKKNINIEYIYSNLLKTNKERFNDMQSIIKKMFNTRFTRYFYRSIYNLSSITDKNYMVSSGLIDKPLINEISEDTFDDGLSNFKERRMWSVLFENKILEYTQY